MPDTDPINHDHEAEEYVDPANTEFVCPNCGKVGRDEVMFLCNTCQQADMVYKDGIYICPACLAPGENFECLNCESKEVKMKVKH